MADKRFETVINLDEMDASGVRSVEIIEGEPEDAEEEYCCGYNTVSGAFHKPGCTGECGIMNPGEAVKRRRMERRKAKADARKLADAAPSSADLKMAQKHGWRYWFDNYQEMLNANTANIRLLQQGDTRIAELEAQLADWKAAHERAAVIAAEEVSRQTEELKKQLAEALRQRDMVNLANAKIFEDRKAAEVQLAEAIRERDKTIEQCNGHFDKWQDEANAMRAQLAEAKRERDNCAKTAIELLGSSFCDAHGEKVKQLNFSAFSEWVKQMGCLPCAIARLATALAKQEKSAEKAELREGALRAALTTIRDWPFDIRGDCVADARRLADSALSHERQEGEKGDVKSER